MSGVIFLVIYLLFWLGPIIPGVLIAQKKNRSPHIFWLGIIPGFAFWIFIIMLFLKPLGRCSSCGKKLPAGSKVCPYCAAQVETVQKSEEELKQENKARRKTTLITLAAVTAIIIVLIGAIFCFINATFANSEPYKTSIALIQANDETSQYLGGGFKRKGMFSGSINTSADGSGTANFSYKVQGQNGISRVYVDAEKKNGVWTYSEIMFFKILNDAEYIDLLTEANQ